MTINVAYRSAWVALLALASVAAIRAEPVDFTLSDVDGKQIRLSDYRGRWVVVNFWATWCGPCIREIPELMAFQAFNPQHQVLGINFEEITAAEAKAFAQEYKINYPILKIGDQPLVPFEPLQGLPSTAIVSPAGEMVGNHAGITTRAMLEDFISQETGATPPAE